MKRIISVIIALSLILFAFASCGGSADNKEVTGSGGSVLVNFTMEDGKTFSMEVYPNY